MKETTSGTAIDFTADEMKIGMAFSLVLKEYAPDKQEIIENEVLKILLDSMKNEKHPLNIVHQTK